MDKTPTIDIARGHVADSNLTDFCFNHHLPSLSKASLSELSLSERPLDNQSLLATMWNDDGQPNSTTSNWDDGGN
ncbi:hypothetical protein V2G26_010202 [Clonostachys chloroleuca]